MKRLRISRQSDTNSLTLPLLKVNSTSMLACKKQKIQMNIDIEAISRAYILAKTKSQREVVDVDVAMTLLHTCTCITHNLVHTHLASGLKADHYALSFLESIFSQLHNGWHFNTHATTSTQHKIVCTGNCKSINRCFNIT